MERQRENWSVDLSRAAFEEIEKQAKGNGMVSNTKHLSHRSVQQQNVTVPTSPSLTDCLLTSTQTQISSQALLL